MKKQPSRNSKSSKSKIEKTTKSLMHEPTIQPLNDRVLVRPASSEEKQTPSGIFIPETIDKEKPEQGVVVAVGPGRYEDGDLIPMRVAVGDTVMFSKYGFDEIKVDGVEYYIIKEENLLAIIK